jgi:hypothetical protein
MKVISVEQFEYKTAKPPDILDSGGQGNCIVVGAIYGNKGYMVHLPFEDACLDKMICDLKRDVTEKGELKIYLAGGGLTSDDVDEELNLNQHVMALRKYVVDKIAEAGFSDNIMAKKWAKPNDMQGLQLLLSEKIAKYDETPDMETEVTEEYIDRTILPNDELI